MRSTALTPVQILLAQKGKKNGRERPGALRLGWPLTFGGIMSKVVAGVAGLVELLPVMMGFRLEGSVAVCGTCSDGRLLFGRLDAGVTSRDTLGAVFTRLAAEGVSKYLVVAYVDDEIVAALVDHVAATLFPGPVVTVWAAEGFWVRLDTGERQPRDPRHPAVLEYRLEATTRPMAASRDAYVADLVEHNGEGSLSEGEVAAVTIDRSAGAVAAWLEERAGQTLTREELVHLLAHLQHGACRDDVYAAVVEIGPDAVADLLTQVVTATADQPLATHPLAVLALVAYVEGDTVTASGAVERATRIGGHSGLLTLMGTVLDNALDPKRVLDLLRQAL